MDTPWGQVFVEFNDWSTAEPSAASDLAPLLDHVETAGLITSWFFIRKAPCWRVRFHPGDEPADEVTSVVHHQLDELVRAGRIASWTETIYEPEIHAFGGETAMNIAHNLFHQDSRQVMAYLATDDFSQRRELAVLLACLFLRAARLDWNEQGDVWARLTEHRDIPSATAPGRLKGLQPALRRLMTVDTTKLIQSGPLEFVANWATAFTDAGTRLADLATTGELRRGLRAVLALHVIFAWNRLGLPHATQALLSEVAKRVVFGDPA